MGNKQQFLHYSFGFALLVRFRWSPSSLFISLQGFNSQLWLSDLRLQAKGLSMFFRLLLLTAAWTFQRWSKICSSSPHLNPNLSFCASKPMLLSVVSNKAKTPNSLRHLRQNKLGRQLLSLSLLLSSIKHASYSFLLGGTIITEESSPTHLQASSLFSNLSSRLLPE